MRPSQKLDAQRWLRQSEYDLLVGRTVVRDGFYSHACFFAQQAAEKALKALHILARGRAARIHQVTGASGLIQAIEVTFPSLTSFEKEAGILDQYYMATRYPDALPDNAPYEEFNEDQAEEAIGIAQRILSEVTRILDES